MYMQSDLIEVKVVDSAGTIIINRPEHENRLTRLMVRQLADALDDLYQEKSVRAIILTGAGETFCAGIDLDELHEDFSASKDIAEAQKQWGDDAAAYCDLLVRMLEITKPVIASVNGLATSAGAGLVAASDMVVASSTATIGFPDPKLGLIAGVAAPLVCHRVGIGQAARLLLTSVILDAEESQRLGLFQELVDPGKEWAHAMELTQEIAAGAPEAIQLTKRLLSETIGEQLKTQLTTGAVMQATSCTTEAAKEGIAAFLEGREPEWK